MTHNERLEGLDRIDLTNLVEMANKRLKELEESKKSEYFVVSDSNLNLGIFRMENLEGAIEFLAKTARRRASQGYYDILQIDVQRWYDHEIEDLIVEKE